MRGFVIYMCECCIRMDTWNASRKTEERNLLILTVIFCCDTTHVYLLLHDDRVQREKKVA